MDITDQKYAAAFEKLGYRFPSRGQLKHIRHSHYTDGAKFRYNLTLTLPNMSLKFEVD